MRRVWLVAAMLLASGTARSYQVFSIPASELHQRQAHPLRGLLIDARERSRMDMQAWLGDPGGPSSDLIAGGLAMRWHRTLDSGLGYGAAIGVHAAQMGGWMAAGEISHAIAEREDWSVGTTAILGYQRMEDGFALSCTNDFGGYAETGVERLEYFALGAALHGERRFAWLRLGLDLLYTQMIPNLEATPSLLPAGQECDDDHEEIQHDLALAGGLGLGGESLNLYAGVAPGVVMLRLTALF